MHRSAGGLVWSKPPNFQTWLPVKLTVSPHFWLTSHDLTQRNLYYNKWEGVQCNCCASYSSVRQRNIETYGKSMCIYIVLIFFGIDFDCMNKKWGENHYTTSTREFTSNNSHSTGTWTHHHRTTSRSTLRLHYTYYDTGIEKKLFDQSYNISKHIILKQDTS